VPRSDRRKKAPASKLLVVDASVLRASGSTEAIHPVAANCRDILMIILDVCHGTAVTAAILEEWNRHQSRFARTWRNSMYARGKVVSVSAAECSDVHTALKQSQDLSANEVSAAEKDLHLIAAARSADRTIISSDNAALAVFRKLTLVTGTIADIFWVDPVSDLDGLRLWLEADGPPGSHWRIGSAAATAESQPRHGGARR
jgi:hypothetical protein